MINNLARAQSGINLGQIARGEIDFAKNQPQRILSGNMGRAVVIFAGNNEFHGLSKFRNLLERVEIYSESMMVLFNSGPVPNVMSLKMVNKLNSE